MMPMRTIMDHVLAEPFQSFAIHTAGGRTFEVRHPEFLKLGKRTLTVFGSAPGNEEGPQKWEDVSLTLIESISLLGGSVSTSGR